MKKIVLLVIGMLLLTALPITIGLNTNQKPTQDSTTDIGSTFVRGFITKPRLSNMGQEISFRAIYVHYRTMGLGADSKGVLRGLQKITLANEFTGILQNHYVFAKFDGKLDI